MKLKEYIKNLQEIAEEYGDDLDIVWAIDDEGNDYRKVDNLGIVGHFVYNGHHDNEFYDEESCYNKDYKINSVLIN